MGNAMEEDPAWELITTKSFEPHTDSTENSLLAQTLRTDRGVLAVQTYLRRPIKAPESPNSTPASSPTSSQAHHHHQSPLVEEVCMIFSLGDGVNGIKDTCHGGLISLMLDEATGTFAAENFGRYNIITAGLNVSFRRRLETPAIVFCKAYQDRATTATGQAGGRGRKKKINVEGHIEDQSGRVYATGKAVFLSRNANL